jgi:hypothetical protein
MDFTLDLFRSFLTALLDAGYMMMPVSDWSSNNLSGCKSQLMLRHDVDRKPERSLATAGIEHSLGVRGTYYFRITPESYDVNIIREVASLGHEIGYHYEDCDLVNPMSKTDQQKLEYDVERDLVTRAFGSFKENLAKIREVVPIKTICMHGSPMSRYDSRLLWKYFDYGELGIETEPYFDLSLDDMLYLTDTGRRWNGSSVSVRDRIYVRDDTYYEGWVRRPVAGSAMKMTVQGMQFQKRFRFRRSADILSSVRSGDLPGKLFLTFHPQRWSDSLPVWIAELASQNLKNTVKYIINKIYL